jgi:hypothetical protein
MAEPSAIVSTTLLDVLIFSGDKDTREYDGRKHIGAAYLLREMARRTAANPAWNDKAAIRHCVRSFRNLNEPTISADRSWAYLNFGTSHTHRF